MDIIPRLQSEVHSAFSSIFSNQSADELQLSLACPMMAAILSILLPKRVNVRHADSRKIQPSTRTA